MLLRAGGALQLAIDRKVDGPVPCIISGNLGLAWVAEWVYLHHGGELLVILGPVYLKNTALEQSLQGLDRLGVSQHLQRQYLNVLSDVPVLGYEMLLQYARILHFICYQDPFTPLFLAPEGEAKTRSPREEKTSAANANDAWRSMKSCCCAVWPRERQRRKHETKAFKQLSRLHGCC